MKRKIKVLLANHPRMMRDVIRQFLEHETDMEIVGETVDPLTLLLSAKETAADVVVIALSDSETPGVVSHLFAECPNITVLGLKERSDGAVIEQLRPWRKEIGDLSATNILVALRQVVQEPWNARDG